MIGIDKTTGKHLDGLEHLNQSITDILTTPIGSRVYRREYGSRLFELVDAPINESFKLDIIAETAEALERWEPRFKLKTVYVEASPGSVIIDLDGEYLENGEPIKIEGIKIK